MPVIQAKSAGFCYGVRRAVELAEKTARENGGCVMLGSIIHNANVVARLERLGARQADTPDQVAGRCGGRADTERFEEFPAVYLFLLHFFLAFRRFCGANGLRHKWR